MHTKNKQAGFSPIVVLLIAVILGLIGFAGWFVYQNNKTTTKSGSTSGTGGSYDSCVEESGSVSLQSYPETCVTKGGKHYTNTSQKADTLKYLTIKEWGVKLPLTADIADATYTVQTDGTTHVSTKKIAELAKTVTGCKAGIDDIYVQRTSTAPTGEGVAPQIGKYYFSQYSPIEPTCAIPANDAISQIWDLQKLLVDAIQGITAN